MTTGLDWALADHVVAVVDTTGTAIERFAVVQLVNLSTKEKLY